ncbi:MAG: lipocalin-like domain-containing protein [Burkholderiales bacterium]|nr:lipocalin-like domain-containing protein [Burkholderiales bacterium]
MNAVSNPLLGSWRLRRWEVGYADGRPASLPYGADALGLLVYAGDGWMSAAIARAGRNKLASESVRSAPPEQRLAAFEGYFHYAGRYALESGSAGLFVVHRVTMSLNPNFVGSEQRRRVEFDAAGRLTLSADDLLPGTQVLRHHRLLWQRDEA